MHFSNKELPLRPYSAEKSNRNPDYNIEIPASEVKSKPLSNGDVEYTFTFNIAENLGTSSDFVLVARVEDDSNQRVKGSIESF